MNDDVNAFFLTDFAVQALTYLTIRGIDLLSLRQKILRENRTLQRMLMEAHSRDENAEDFAERIALAYSPKK